MFGRLVFSLREFSELRARHSGPDPINFEKIFAFSFSRYARTRNPRRLT